jgi:hypothetical protein
MTKYVSDILKENNVLKKSISPAADLLFQVNDESELLDEKDCEIFHSVVAKILYLAKRARGDVLPATAFLTTRVLKPTIEDWNKLGKLLSYLHQSKDLVMKLSCDTSLQVQCFVDASFANHPDYKSHSGCVLTLGSGAVYCKSSKQSLVTKSSTEAELVAISDCISVGIWARNFLQVQNGPKCHLSPTRELPPVLLWQDNMSTIFLVEKGRSSSTRTRHVNIRYFFIHDRIVLGEVSVRYKPTGVMIADIMTKPMQGTKFRQMRKLLLYNDDCDDDHVNAKDDEDI